VVGDWNSYGILRKEENASLLQANDILKETSSGKN
jgi:hypothetical protein